MHQAAGIRRRGSSEAQELWAQPSTYLSKARKASMKTWLQAALALVGIFFIVTLLRSAGPADVSSRVQGDRLLGELSTTQFGPVMVSYSYFEKDPGQLSNGKFFIAVAMGVDSTFPTPAATDYSFVISGDMCEPCKDIDHLVSDDTDAAVLPQLKWAKSGDGLVMMQRTFNEGMDFAAHNVTIEWLKVKRQLKRYRYFIFLNSSVRGPFFPSYMPPNWQWTRAYTDRLTDEIKVVSSSIVCLPSVDAGGFGPKVESWAFALDPVSLELLTEAGVFYSRVCKLCDDGVVVGGEYGLSKTLLAKGYNLATLMSKYPKGTDWRDERHWHCNNNVHPSRHGSYDGISMHPFETMFVKASWHVGEPHLSHYTNWYLDHAAGRPSTAGAFNEKMYRYAISMQAQEPNNAEQCFKVL